MTNPSSSQKTRRRRRALGIILLLTVALVAGCQVSYYGQAVNGHMEIWWKQRPAIAVAQDPDTPEDLREKLEFVQRLLVFAEEELLLPNDGNYTRYADLEREFVVWSVFAAPRLDVEPVRWKYPVVGELAYRGYYKEKDAEAFGDRQRAKDLDVAVVGVPAYSTLGWFKDPLLNTFIDYDEEQLASLIFHELAHKKYYRHGDTEFSEAFAVAVEEEGVRRWLAVHGTREEQETYEKNVKRVDDFIQLLLDARADLEAVYASTDSDSEKLARKKGILDELQTRVRQILRDAGREPKDTFWLRDDINNAHLNIIATYHLMVPEFEAVLRECGGDLEKFYAAVEEMP